MDIAFPDKQIGIEINGNQHYERNGDLKPYYKDRHNYLECMGWKIYELHYKIPYSDKILDIINNIGDALIQCFYNDLERIFPE